MRPNLAFLRRRKEEKRRRRRREEEEEEKEEEAWETPISIDAERIPVSCYSSSHTAISTLRILRERR